jgi:nitrogen fixation/metabolism regulation signal transduction histidine kinase
MPDLLLTFHCATRDLETALAAIRTVAQAPIHIREEAVRGRDFSDARTVEQVTGNLRRNAIELIVADTALEEVVRAVADSRHEQPVRWHTLSIIHRGRII